MTATIKRRRKRDPLAGKATLYRGLDQDGVELFPPFPEVGPALSKTITYASKTPEEQTYYVNVQHLFGPSVDLYEVKRTKDGRILTTTLTTEV